MKEKNNKERKPSGQVHATWLAKGGKTNEMVDFAIVFFFFCPAKIDILKWNSSRGTRDTTIELSM